MVLLSRLSLSIIFIPLFAFFLIATSIQFQILNYDFLISSFRSHQVYSKMPLLVESALLEQKQKSKGEFVEEKTYRAIAESLTPEVFQDFVETNLKEVILFLNGKAPDMVLTIPTGKLGLSRVKTMQEKISLKSFATKQEGFEGLLSLLQGVGKISVGLWLVLLIVGALVLKANASLGSGKQNRFFSLALILTGLLFLGLSSVVLFFVNHMSSDLTRVSSEPSQVLIGLLAGSVLLDVTYLWLALSGVLGLSGVGAWFWKRF